MIIWMDRIVHGDPKWDLFRALLQVVPLEPRKPVHGRSGAQREYFTSANEYLARPRIKEGRSTIDAPYWSFNVQCSAYVTAIGQIPLDADEQLDEFLTTIRDALEGEFTDLMRRRWQLGDQARVVARQTAGDSREDPLVRNLLEQAQALAEQGEVNYNLARRQLDEDVGSGRDSGRRETRHDLVVEILKEMGLQRLAASESQSRPRQATV